MCELNLVGRSKVVPGPCLEHTQESGSSKKQGARYCTKSGRCDSRRKGVDSDATFKKKKTFFFSKEKTFFCFFVSKKQPLPINKTKVAELTPQPKLHCFNTYVYQYTLIRLV